MVQPRLLHLRAAANLTSYHYFTGEEISWAKLVEWRIASLCILSLAHPHDSIDLGTPWPTINTIYAYIQTGMHASRKHHARRPLLSPSSICMYAHIHHARRPLLSPSSIVCRKTHVSRNSALRVALTLCMVLSGCHAFFSLSVEMTIVAPERLRVGAGAGSGAGGGGSCNW